MYAKTGFQIERLQQGYLVSFQGEEPGLAGARFAARSAAEIREILGTELEKRITKMIDQVTTPESAERTVAPDIGTEWDS